MNVLSTAFMQDIMPLLVAVGAPFKTPSLGLFTNNIVPTFTTVLAGLTEPTMTGYARAVPTFATMYGKPDGSIVLNTELVEFSAPSDATGQIIYGYFITDGGSPEKLLITELFTTPINLSTPPISVVFSGQFALRPANNNGVYTQVAP